MKRIVSVLVLAFVSICGFGQSDALRTQHFNLKKSIAIEGYDPVSYFQGLPLEGTQDFKFTYKGATYHFATQANLDSFKLAPHKYEPVYGGWCAYAMGKSGEKVKIDPETFKIVEGKVYLFYNFWGNNTLEAWNKNEKKLKVSADHNWKNIVR
jgi:YHS domain-containing protein